MKWERMLQKKGKEPSEVSNTIATIKHSVDGLDGKVEEIFRKVQKEIHQEG